MSGRTVSSARRHTPRMPDSDDSDLGDEPMEETLLRSRKGRARAAVPGVTTRVAVKNSPNRGSRVPRSGMDRAHLGRTGNGRDAHQRTAEFTEAEIRSFMAEEENLIPFVHDTRDWHYKWARHILQGKDDGANVVANLNGKMGWELVVGPDMLPKGLNLKSLSIKDGDFANCYQFRDTILMRCPMRNHKLSIVAARRRTQQLNEMLDAGTQAAGIPGEERTGIVVEENVERTGIREVEPSADEEAA